MRTLDLSKQSMTIEELLQLANQESLRILSQDGTEFILEVADVFEQEVAQLGQSKKFVSFLSERSKEPGYTTLEEIERRLLQAE